MRVEETTLPANPNDGATYRMQFAEFGVYDGFADDFGSGFANNWAATRGKWTVAAGRDSQTEAASATTTILQSAWSDATFEYDFRIDGGSADPTNWTGANLRKSKLDGAHGDSGYLVYCRANGEIALSSAAGVLATFNSGVAFDTPTHVKIVTLGNEIQVFVGSAATAQIIHGREQCLHERLLRPGNVRSRGQLRQHRDPSLIGVVSKQLASHAARPG